jgi:cell wall-associated NlpC family hydrolase
MNPDLREFVTASRTRGRLPSIDPVKEWIGRPYKQGECWKFVRDAFEQVAGVKLADDYYASLSFFTQVHRVAGTDVFTGASEIFAPQPWDVVMLRTIDNVPIFVGHPGIVIDGDRYMMTWADAGAGIYRFDDERVSFRVRGFMRLIG